MTAVQPREAFELDCQLGKRNKLLIFFDEQGAEILYRRLNAPRGFNEVVFLFIRDVADALLSHQPKPLGINELRESYSGHICKAMANAVGENFLFSMLYDTEGWANEVFHDANNEDILPAGAAAVGDVALLQRFLDPMTLSPGNRFLLGTLLEAATAAGQCEAIDLILNTTKVPNENVHNAIHEALRIAIVRNQVEALKTLLYYVQRRGGKFVVRKQEALKGFIQGWMYAYDPWRLYAMLALYCDGAITVDPDLRQHLFEKGHRGSVKRLICGGHVDSNEHILGVSSLLFTLIKERYRTFEMLLDNGANIDSHS